MSEQRFIELETKLAHQEALLEELHEVLYKQQARIDQLTSSMKVLIQRNDDEEETKVKGAQPKAATLLEIVRNVFMN